VVPRPTGDESSPPDGFIKPGIRIGTEFVGPDKPFILEKSSGMLSKKTILEKCNDLFRNMDVLRVVAKKMPLP
jgi:hypothetical protein